MNFERFCIVLSHIEKHPEQWDQTAPESYYPSCCFLAHASRRARPGEKVTTRPGVEWLGLKYGEPLTKWLWSPSRKLEDFRALRRGIAISLAMSR